MNEQDILDWLEENYDRNPDAGSLVYYREDVLEKLIKMQKCIAELEKTIKSLTDGVTHFHKSHGDMNPLLTAYIEALKEQGQ